MHVFGLTGGIASGKSAVAERLRARGVPVIDADRVARDVVAKGTPGLDAVVRTFGIEFLDEDGELDRKKLAREVFADDAKRKALNGILHPRIGEATFERTRVLAEEGHPLACYEAALLVENGIADAFRPLVVVTAPEDEQIRRAMKRDQATEAEARARMAAQMPLEAKIAVADFVVDNAGSIAELEPRVDDVLDAICEKLGVDARRYPKP